jgi:hypothetical protein
MSPYVSRLNALPTLEASQDRADKTSRHRAERWQDLIRLLEKIVPHIERL